MVLKQDGSVWLTGENDHGQLGDDSQIDNSTFVQVIESNAIAVSAGYEHTMVVKQDGTLWAAGQNHYGQLGDGSSTNRKTLKQITIGS